MDASGEKEKAAITVILNQAECLRGCTVFMQHLILLVADVMASPVLLQTRPTPGMYHHDLSVHSALLLLHSHNGLLGTFFKLHSPQQPGPH